MKFDVQINNLAQLQEAFMRAPLIAEGTLQEAILQCPEILASFTVPPIVPYRTGQLAETFFSQISGLIATWGPTVNYAAAVEFGTGPHVILPVNKKALYWRGAKHPVRKVNHPGSAANPYMERIVMNAVEPINALFVEALQVIVENIAAGGL